MQDSATTAAMIAALLAMVKVIEKLIQKSNGGSVEYRLQCLEKATEKRMDQLQTKLQDFSRAFFEFREEQKIHNVLQRQSKGDDE